MKRVVENYGMGFSDAVSSELEPTIMKVAHKQIQCSQCGVIIRIDFPEMLITMEMEKHIREYYEKIIIDLANENKKLKKAEGRGEGECQNMI